MSAVGAFTIVMGGGSEPPCFAVALAAFQAT